MLQQFLNDLFYSDQVRVVDPRPISQSDKNEAASVLWQFEQEYRVTLPGDPPSLNLHAAIWSAASLYTASSLVVYRDLNEKEMNKLFGDEVPETQDADIHYAVDLTMRFLPDLIKLAKSAATDDPLLARLRLWARDWPLSSVGITDVESVDTKPLQKSPSLMQLYTDRVIMTDDYSRLDDPIVFELVRSALGDFPELCPSLAKEINNTHLPLEEC